MLTVLGVIVGVSFWLTYGVMAEHQRQAIEEMRAAANGGGTTNQHDLNLNGGRGQVRPGALGSFTAGHDGHDAAPKEAAHEPSATVNEDRCEFRKYPPNRLYGNNNKQQPDFLSDATYIRGQWPIILNPSIDNVQTATKICINTTSWENLSDSTGKERLPFTDGHNPSVISLESTSSPKSTNDGIPHHRIDHSHLQPILDALLESHESLNSLYMGITVFGSGQCKFGLTPQDIDTYRFSTHEEVPNGKRAVISIHEPPNSSIPFETIAQTTLLLERDAKYGTNRRALPVLQNNGQQYARVTSDFDDPRFFFHQGRIWVLYRNGPLFGYNDQIHNPIHFEAPSEDGKKDGVPFVAYVKASETVRVCCGRNIALISEETELKDGVVTWVQTPTLKALTWVDPVTVVDVNLGDVMSKLNGRRLDEDLNPYVTHQHSNNLHLDHQHRRLKEKGSPKSHIHGTNGYMVPLPSTGELLGIAHFHRPEDRKSSDHALHGHHYTHVFFTVARQNDGIFKLNRLSNEFMFQAQYSPIDDKKLYHDGDIIQFASGLDLVGNDIDGSVVISYGINDCEGAVFTIPVEKVSKMLIAVQSGEEVVDLMAKVTK